MSIINDALKKVQKSMRNEPSEAPTPKTPITTPTLGRDQDHDQDNPLPLPRINKSLLNSDTTLSSLHPKPVPKAETTKTGSRPSGPSIIQAALTTPGQRKYQRTIIALCGSICLTLIFLIGYLLYIFGASRPHPEARRFLPNEIAIQGIITRDDKNMALINDEIYEVGQTVKGRKILNISENSVEISYRGKTKTLQVK